MGIPRIILVSALGILDFICLYYALYGWIEYYYPSSRSGDVIDLSSLGLFFAKLFTIAFTIISLLIIHIIKSKKIIK